MDFQNKCSKSNSTFQILLILFTSYFAGAFCNENQTFKPVFLSTHYTLSILASNEEKVYQILKNYYVNSQNDISKELTSYLKDYEDSSRRVEPFEPGYFENIVADHPFLSFRLLYRTGNKLKKMFRFLDTETKGLLQNIIEDVEKKIGWPTVADVFNSISAILRIIHVYDPNLEEFVKGNLLWKSTPYQLRAKHCYEIGKYALRTRHFVQALEWIEIAIKLILYDKDDTAEVEYIQEWLTYAIMNHDIELQRVKSDTDRPFLYAHLLAHSDPNGSRLKYRNHLMNYWKGMREANFNTINFWYLCSGEDLRTEEEKSKLYCWYKRDHPALVINPLKVEQLSNKPYLIQIYEVFSDTLIEKMIKLARPFLRKSEIYKLTPDSPPHRDRTSSTFWVDELASTDLYNIPKIVEEVTGLRVIPKNSSEPLQIAQYTFGQHYEIHRDALIKDDGIWGPMKGDRIATFMLYLNDVEVGGYTAFPQAGIAVKPVKASGVFWYNLYRDGIPDDLSWHGACPVVLGNKWVSNKWIHSHDQFLIRPCTLNPE